MDKKIVLVVPSIRENSWNRFVDEWDSVDLFKHVDVMLMEDNPKPTFKTDPGFIHFSWEDIENELGPSSWIIPRRSDTVRSYAYYKAWKLDLWDYTLTLDDDCYPATDEHDGFHYEDGGLGFLKSHLAALESTGSKWFNTLTKVKPRGIPFYNKGALGHTIVNHGLWTNVLDYDAPTQLAAPTPEDFAFDSRIVPHGQYFPMCGMNVMWARHATVLMYHLLMGQAHSGVTRVPHRDGGMDVTASQIELSRLPFDRFGDIWCGIFMKKIADLNGYTVKTGLPYIHHDRASNPFANLKKEANGLEVNEKLWEYVDKYNTKWNNLAEQYEDFGLYIAKYNDFPEHAAYFRRLGEAMAIWGRLFQGK